MARYLNVLAFAAAIALVTVQVAGDDGTTQLYERGLEKREFTITFFTFRRLLNAHKWIMIVVFCILFPLGAISVHLPIDRIPGFKNSILRKKILALHAPIQMIGLFLMIAGMGIGIFLANQLDMLMGPQMEHHPVIGLVVCVFILAFMPILGTLQHLHYRKTGQKSIFAYLHRWIGRGAILLGIINAGLGLQLVDGGKAVRTDDYVYTFVIAGVLVIIWFGLAALDLFKNFRGRKTEHLEKN